MAKSPKKIDLIYLKHNIDQFNLAAQRAAEEVHIGGKVIMLPIAAHTLHCFVIELSFKWIIATRTGEMEHGHDLTSLFNKIDDGTKQAIYMFMGVSTADQPVFLKKLADMATDFMDCRYFAEDMPGLKFDPSFSSKLANAMVELISLSPKSKPTG
ncbi:hypothetical protein [Asticcacaulis sp.]|uniref:hypothetical protein n=1 Tax=Asticcacaulis sp. TaxID=1872648 RepID=UPI003F7C0673